MSEAERRLRPWAETALPEAERAGPVLIADPEAGTPCPRALTGPVHLIVGPEGGFQAHELELLGKHGGRTVGLGERVLRVETAVVALLARLAP